MKISELIESLSAMMERHGDLDCFTEAAGTLWEADVTIQCRGDHYMGGASIEDEAILVIV